MVAESRREVLAAWGPTKRVWDVASGTELTNAVAGLEYRLYYQDWKDRMRSIVAGASRHMEANLGLRFIVAETRPWEYKGARSPKNPDETIEQLLRIDPGKCDSSARGARSGSVRSGPRPCQLCAG